jgi:hypothetical protein
MSRRNKPRPPRRPLSLLLPVVALGAVLVIAAIFLLARRGDSGGTPHLAVDTQKIDYGYVKFGETRAFEINVTNTGDGALRFAKRPYIEVLEGC